MNLPGFYQTPLPPKAVTTPTPLPGPARLATNAAQAVVRNLAHLATGGPLRASEAAVTARREICRACELYRADQDRCAHASCGCFLKAKAWLHAERCPVGKW